MNILNIIQCTNLGGMEWASTRLMVELIKRGHRCDLISLNAMGPLDKILDNHGISYQSLNYTHDSKLVTFIKLRKLLKTKDVDAVVLTGHNLVVSLALIGTGIKSKICAIHYHHQGVLAKWKWILVYFIKNFVFKIITFPSDYVRNEASSIYKPISKKSRTVRNPLSIPSVSLSESDVSNFKKFHGIPANSKLVGNAGWLIHRKRFDVFLNTARILLESDESIHFIIAGDGDLRDELEAYAKETHIAKNVHFLGWLSDLSVFYTAIDVLLFNSDWDCFPTTPIEAMSFQKPVVASIAHGGLSEILSQDNGWIIDNHDPSKLSEFVKEALSDKGRTKAAFARMTIYNMCDPTVIGEQFESYLLGD